MIVGFSIDGCAACETVAADAEDAQINIEWRKISSGDPGGLAREMLAELLAKTDTDDEVKLPVIMICGDSAVWLFCRLWETVPAPMREVACADGVCSLSASGQVWDFTEGDDGEKNAAHTA